MVADTLFFLAFMLLLVYPAGNLILGWLEVKLNFFQSLVFGLIIGFTFLTVISLALGFIGILDFYPFLVILILLFFIYKHRGFRLSKLRIKISLDDFPAMFSILLCTAVLGAIVFPNGLRPNGIYLNTVFVEDGMWHIAVIKSLLKSIPPENPLFAGERLVGYNYFSDVFISIIHKFTKIDILVLYFKLLGPFIAFLSAASTYFLFRKIIKNKTISAIGVLIVTLSSNYYYLVALFKPEKNLTPGSFFINGFTTRMINYQLSFSYLIFIVFIFLLFFASQPKGAKFYLVAGVLLGSAIGFKSYASVVIMAIFVFGGIKAITKEFKFILVAIFGGLFTAVFTILFLHNSQANDSIFIFKPFWIIDNMFSDPIRLGSPAWGLQKLEYVDKGNLIGIAYLYIKGIVIFVFVNFGLKLLGLFSLLNKHKDNTRDLVIFLVIVSILGIFAPLLFMQSGVGWNTVQFSYYSSFSLGILLVIFLSVFLIKMKSTLRLFVMLFIWATFLPGVIKYTKYYLSGQDNLTRYNFVGTQGVYQGAEFLSKQKNGVLLLSEEYKHTPFVMGVSGKNAYFADSVILSGLLIDWQERNDAAESFFARPEGRENFLRINKITYVFSSKLSLEDEPALENIYTNQDVTVYRVR